MQRLLKAGGYEGNSELQITCCSLLQVTMSYLHKEEQLLEAIETGNLERVKQLVASGISVNALLHSTSRRESATLLGTASYEGHTHIVEYLLSCKALVNYRDPLFRRNALHWACMGGHYDVVSLLLQHFIDVNCVDRDNVTPIIRAAMAGDRDIVVALLETGANVNQFDRLHSSALHYASFHGHKHVVTALIKAGCVANNTAIFGQGTPLANLVYHGDIANCHLLVEAGYNLKEDTWIPKYKFPHHQEKEFHIAAYLLDEFRNPSPLIRLCRAAIRAHLGGTRLSQKINKLSLPCKVTQFLLIDDISG